MQSPERVAIVVTEQLVRSKEIAVHLHELRNDSFYMFVNVLLT